MGKKLSRGN